MKNTLAVVAISLAALPLVFCLELFCKEGPCCQDGKFLSSYTACRPAENECDATDYCTGFSSQCPIDISIAEGTPCGGLVDPGKCVDGFCWNSVVKAKVDHCANTCSKSNGNCSQNGTCVCYEPWKNPPFCNIKGGHNNSVNQSNENDFLRYLEIINNITAKRLRRSSGNKHHHHHSNQHHAAPASHQHKPKAVALPMMVEDPPKQDVWTKYSQNPLFIPIVVTIVALIILIVFGIWATALYQSEIKARKLKERIKVHKSRRKVTKDTSMIRDPSVTIDVGQ